MKKYFADGTVIEGTPEEIRMYEHTHVQVQTPVVHVQTKSKNGFNYMKVMEHFQLKKYDKNVCERERYWFNKHNKYSWEVEKKARGHVNKSGWDLSVVEAHYGHKITSADQLYYREHHYFKKHGRYSWERKNKQRGFSVKILNEHYGKTFNTSSVEYKKEANYFYNHGRYSWQPKKAKIK